MSLLARFRALTKILAIVILMSATAIGITWVGVSALNTLNTGADNMKKSSSRAMTGARANLNVLALSRAEYRVALDARPESRTALRKLVDDQLKLLKERIEDINKTRDEKARGMLPAVREALAEYEKGLAATFHIADEVKEIQSNEQTERLRDSAGKSRAVAQKLQAALGAVSDRLSERVDVYAQEAVEEYETSSRLMMIVSAAGIVIALAFGFMIGQFGIAKPMGSLVALLQRMAKGEDVEITGTERRDEVGQTARAVTEIKVMLAEKARQEAEAKAEQDRKLAADRAAAEQQMAAEFEEAVGGIVQAAVAGDFSQRVDLNGKTGLVLNVGSSLNTLCQNVAMALDELIGMLNALAEGDLTKRIIGHYEGNFATLKDNANKTAERIGSTVSEIKTATREVTNASTEITTSTTDLSQRTEEQAASLEQTSASMEQISATVKKNAESAQQVNQAAGTTRDVAVRGSEVVASAVTAMAKIEESSGKISDIIGVIDEIARQTNLLALNAAVEAARAGEAGRGFAVVASEVRSLAQRSAQAAKDIKDLITDSTGLVKEGVDLVNRAGTSLDEIVGSIKKVADVVADIAAASVEQSSGIEQVNKALTQMDEVTQQNSALVEENAATAKTLEQQAKAMDQRVAFFRVAEGAAGLGESSPAAAPARQAAKPAPARQAKRPSSGGAPVAGNTALKADDWQEF